MSTQERDDIQRELSTLSCPFTWHLADASKHYMIQKSYTNVTDDNIDEEAHLSLEKFIFSLVVLYEKVLFAEIDCADIKLNTCEELLLEMIDNRHEDDDIIRVVEHLMNSTKCHYFFEINNMEQLKIILPTIIKTSDFTNIELAALAGCQSVAWSMFMNNGRIKAMDLANQAIQQHSDKALWHFILAKNARRDRRLTAFFSAPSEIEKKHFKLAYKKSPNPVFGVYLAQMYRESSWYLSYSQQKITENLVFDLYKEILGLSNNNYKVLLKLAIGFIRIKSNKQAKSLAKYCLDAVEKTNANNSTYLHYKGIYLETFENVKEAFEFYKKHVELYNYAVEMSYVKCGWKAKLLDPLTHLQLMVGKYEKISPEKSQELYLCIATCYYQKGDWKHAMEYYLKAIEADPTNKKLKAHFKFLDFTTKGYRNGLYEFLKLKFLKIVCDCREYRCNDETFIISHNKLQTLCFLHDKELDSNSMF